MFYGALQGMFYGALQGMLSALRERFTECFAERTKGNKIESVASDFSKRATLLFFRILPT